MEKKLDCEMAREVLECVRQKAGLAGMCPEDRLLLMVV